MKLTDKRRTILRALVLAPRPLTAANLSAMTYPYDVRAVRDEPEAFQIGNAIHMHPDTARKFREMVRQRNGDT